MRVESPGQQTADRRRGPGRPRRFAPGILREQKLAFPFPRRPSAPPARLPGPQAPAVGLRFSVLIVAFALLAAGRCAQRMPPPSPDRFPPRLELVRTRGRTGLELLFDEPVDLAGIPAESLRIAGPDGEPLAVRGLTTTPGGERLLVWTGVQEPVVYQLTALAADLAGNTARVRTRFRGSSAADTVAPRVTSVRPLPGQAGYPSEDVRFEFSKPMDTLVPPRFVAIPAELDSLLLPAWDQGWQRLTLRRPALRSGTDLFPGAGALPLVPEAGLRPAEDSTPAPDSAPAVARHAKYVALLPGLSDLEGNPTRSFAATGFTADTIFPGEPFPGRVIAPDGFVGAIPALVFLLADTATGLAATDDRGHFALRIAPGRYEAVAVSDTGGDGRADFVGRLGFSIPGVESILVRLRPETEPRAIGEYRR